MSGSARRNEGHVQPCGPRKSMSRGGVHNLSKQPEFQEGRRQTRNRGDGMCREHRESLDISTPWHPTTPLVMTVGPDSRRSPGRRLRQTPYSRT